MYKSDVVEVYNKTLKLRKKMFVNREELIRHILNKLGSSSSKKNIEMVREAIKGLPTNKIYEDVTKVVVKKNVPNRKVELSDELIERVRLATIKSSKKEYWGI